MNDIEVQDIKTARKELPLRYKFRIYVAENLWIYTISMLFVGSIFGLNIKEVLLWLMSLKF